MTAVLTRGSDEFARLLDGDATTSTSYDASLALAEALVRLGTATATATAVSPEFSTRLRTRLVAVATVQGVGATSTATPDRAVSWRVRRRLTALAGGAALVVSSAGVAVAAGRAVPGSALFGLRHGVESLQLATTSGPQARGRRHLQFARDRMTDLTTMVDDGTSSSNVLAAIAEMNAQTRAGSADLLQAFRLTGGTAPAAALNAFAHEQYAALVAVLPKTTGAEQAQILSALALVRDVEVQSLQMTAGVPAAGSGAPSTAPTHSTGGHSTPSSPTTPHSASPSHPAPSQSPTPAAPDGSGVPTSSTGGTVVVPPLPTSLPTLPLHGAAGVPTTVPSLPGVDNLLP